MNEFTGNLSDFRPVKKTAGQLAFERDVMVNPTYCTGQPRLKWSEIGDIAQWSWERNPTTFDEEATAQRHEEILAGLANEVPHSRFREANGTLRQWTYSGNGSMARIA